MAEKPDSSHFRMVANRLLIGSVVPFLGAGVNLCGRPVAADWQQDHYLPSGGELAEYLPDAVGVDYPYDDPSDLLRVSQYVDVSLGSGVLYDALHTVFDADYSPTPVHRLLADLPALVREHTSAAGRPCFYPLNITTNYDDLLERASSRQGRSSTSSPTSPSGAMPASSGTPDRMAPQRSSSCRTATRSSGATSAR